MGKGIRVCFVRASQQNVFFDELMEAFRDGLHEIGLDVEIATDHFPAVSADLVYVFIPHEYMAGVHEDAFPTRRQRERSVAICTEQPGTHWFDETVEVAATCAAAFDINEIGAEGLRARGVQAGLLRLGHVPSWDKWGGGERRSRPVDLTFMGGHTDRRGLVLARLGESMQDRRCSFHAFETRAHLADDPHFLSGDRKWELLRSAKAIVNVHRSKLGYLEWQRVIGAMINGCVVITEHSEAYKPLIPGEHFVSARFEDLHLAVDAALSDPEYLKSMRQKAYVFLREEFPMDQSVQVLADTLDRVASKRLSCADAGEPVPAPRPVDRPLPEPAFARYRLYDEEVLERMALKHLLLEVRGLRNELHPGPPSTNRIESYGDHTNKPRVSVVVTVYNYAQVVGDALMSVARSEHDALELIVIDDASTDDSVEVIRATLASVPWIPSRLVRRSRNSGLSAGRNLGFELARGDLVFVLDADNMVYPRALSLLEDALRGDPDAAFAYGIIEKFDEDGPLDIMSFLGWDPGRLRYGNFVDAMAMIRREAVLGVAGGYVSDSALHGWEDFALWCALASEGCGGVRVPEIVARYRVATHSMISVTNIDASAAWAKLLQSYPVLSRNAKSARHERTLDRTQRLGEPPTGRASHRLELA